MVNDFSHDVGGGGAVTVCWMAWDWVKVHIKMKSKTLMLETLPTSWEKLFTNTFMSAKHNPLYNKNTETIAEIAIMMMSNNKHNDVESMMSIKLTLPLLWLGRCFF